VGLTCMARSSYGVQAAPITGSLIRAFRQLPKGIPSICHFSSQGSVFSFAISPKPRGVPL